MEYIRKLQEKTSKINWITELTNTGLHKKNPSDVTNTD